MKSGKISQQLIVVLLLIGAASIQGGCGQKSEVPVSDEETAETIAAATVESIAAVLDEVEPILEEELGDSKALKAVGAFFSDHAAEDDEEPAEQGDSQPSPDPMSKREALKLIFANPEKKFGEKLISYRPDHERFCQRAEQESQKIAGCQWVLKRLSMEQRYVDSSNGELTVLFESAKVVHLAYSPENFQVEVFVEPASNAVNSILAHEQNAVWLGGPSSGRLILNLTKLGAGKFRASLQIPEEFKLAGVDGARPFSIAVAPSPEALEVTLDHSSHEMALMVNIRTFLAEFSIYNRFREIIPVELSSPFVSGRVNLENAIKKVIVDLKGPLSQQHEFRIEDAPGVVVKYTDIKVEFDGSSTLPLMRVLNDVDFYLLIQNRRFLPAESWGENDHASVTVAFGAGTVIERITAHANGGGYRMRSGRFYSSGTGRMQGEAELLEGECFLTGPQEGPSLPWLETSCSSMM